MSATGVRSRIWTGSATASFVLRTPGAARAMPATASPDIRTSGRMVSVGC